MRNLKAIFIATLLAVGMAQATWHWSPPSYVLPPSDSARTASTNARAIVGTGNTIHVVFARSTKIDDESFLKVYYSRSTDLGLTWTAPYPLSNQESYDAQSPSIGMWDNDNLLVIWNDGDAAHPHSGISVRSIQSADGGQSWVNGEPVNTAPNFACSNPALLCETIATSPYWSAAAVWRESSLVASQQRIAQRPGEFDGGSFSWLGVNENTMPNSPTRRMDLPSVWLNDHFMHTAEVECDAPGGMYSSDTLFYDSTGFSSTSWPAMRAIDGDQESRRCGHPSIMCDGHGEVVAYELGLAQSPRDKQIHVAGRLWNGGNGNPNPFELLSNPVQPSWADSCEFPQLFPFYSGGVETLLMSATGYVNGQTGAKKTFVVESENGLFDWHVLNSNAFPVATDSCSLWGGECGTAMPEVKLHRVWAAATYHAQQAGANSTVLVMTATEQPLTTQSDVHGTGARQIVRQPGTSQIHRVTMLENYLNYERSDDNGATWSYQDAPDFGTNPSLALYDGNPHICYLRNDSVLCAVLNADSAPRAGRTAAQAPPG